MLWLHRICRQDPPTTQLITLLIVSMPYTIADLDEKPTLVIVQGAFQDPSVYEGLEKILSSQGFPIVHPLLLSCSNVESPKFPSITLIDDALAIRMELVRLVEYEGKTVVVVMHSYGGLPGSEAIPNHFSYSTRQAADSPGGVIHLFYVAAFLLYEGQSMMEVFGKSADNDFKVKGSAKLDCGLTSSSGEELANTSLAGWSRLPSRRREASLQ